MKSAIEQWLANRLGVDKVEVHNLGRHTEGWSWHTYTLEASFCNSNTGKMENKGYVIRREPEVGLLPPYDIRGQYELHRNVLDYSDIPMAQLYWLEMDPSILGMPFYIMERVEGIVPVQWRGNDPKIFPSPEVRREIGLNFVDILTKIHSIDLKKVSLGSLGTPVSPEQAVEREINRWEQFYNDSYLLQEPILREVIAWLKWNATTSGRVTLCHGDYRIGNFMLQGKNIVAVFDWELAHIGDPIADIAWSGLPLFRGRSPLLSQLLAPAEYFDRYEQLTGLKVEAKVFRFWTILGFLKASVPHLQATKAFEEGRASDLRLAAMGHQNIYVLKQLAAELGLRKVGVG